MTKLLTTLSFAAVLALGGSALAMGDKTFDELDANKDGTLSKSEAAASADLDFVKADTNKDGRIDRAEYEKAVG